MTRFFLLLIIYTITFSDLLAQGHEFLFEHLTAKEGLSQNDINSIYQDKEGFLWFGTNEGLNRYDGYKIKVYKPSFDGQLSVSSNMISSITQDKDGNVWIATSGEGLNRYNPVDETFRHYKYNPEDSTGVQNNTLRKIWVDENNILWVAAYNKLTYADLNKENTKLVFKKPVFFDVNGSIDSLGKSVNTFYESEVGDLYVGTQRWGMYKKEQSTEDSLYYFRPVELMNIQNRPIKTVRSFCMDNYNGIWLGTPWGLFYKESIKSKQFVKLQGGTINSITKDNLGQMWIGTKNGIQIYKRQSKLSAPALLANIQENYPDPLSLSNNIINTVHKDNYGNLWIGTGGGGVCKYIANKKKFHHYRKGTIKGLSNLNEIKAITETLDGNLWIGTMKGQLIRVKSKSNGLHFKEVKGIISQPSYNIKNTHLTSLHEMKYKDKSILLAGTGNGIRIIDYQDKKVDEIEISRPEFFKKRVGVTTILQDKTGQLWIGTYGQGLFRVRFFSDGSYKTDVFRYWVDKNALASNIIRSFCQDSKGNLWIGTSDGLSKIAAQHIEDEEVKFQNYRTKTFENGNISHNYVLYLYEDVEQQLWIGTFGGGLNKFHPATETEHEFFTAYTEKNGLANNVILGILEDNKKHLWISTNKGISRFNMKKKTFKNFDTYDGLQAEAFGETTCFERANGEMIFGGTHGFNTFFPDQIINNSHVPKVAITDFFINNAKVNINEEINGRKILTKNILYTDELNLNYSENNISFEFTALHYDAPLKNRFAYKLEGFDKHWIHTGASKRFASYTNLPSGKYTLKIKGANNDGVWNNEATSLKITVKPPFYHTWWAYLLYILATGGLLWLLRSFTIINTKEKHRLNIIDMERSREKEIQDMKMRFFTHISHELRTPLTLILAPLENLMHSMEQFSKVDIHNRLNLMAKSTQYMLRIVDQLLEFQTIEKGEAVLKLQEVNIVSLIEQIVTSFQLVVDKKNIQLSVQYDVKELQVWLDTDKVEKILYNLISNAIKFTPENGKITVSLHVEIIQQQGNTPHPAGQYFYIEVKDTGIGIPEMQLANIFDSFANIHKNHPQGAGIGLSFTKSLVAHHLGEIKVVSKEGEGATFTVSLPLSKSIYPKEAFQETVSEKDYKVTNVPENWISSELTSANDQTIENITSAIKKNLPLLLVVDSNKEVRKFIKDSYAGIYRVVTAESADDALKKVGQYKPDLIISDFDIPEMNGLQLCEHIKKEAKWNHIPFMLMTAQKSGDMEISGFKAGVDAFLTKPFSIHLLEARISNLIQSRSTLKSKYKQDLLSIEEETQSSSKDEKFLEKVVQIIEDRLSDPNFNVELLYKELSVSRSMLYNKIKALTNMTTSEFVRSVRLKKAAQLLEQTDLPIKQVIYMTGFSTPSYFSKCFKQQYGILPSEFVKKKGKIKYFEDEKKKGGDL